MNPRTVLLVGLLLGALATGLLPEAWQRGALVGVLAAGLAELVSLRRRTRAIAPQASQAQFAVALAGGFLTKLILVTALTFTGHLLDLFSAPAFLFAFLATALWGEACTVLFLFRTRSRGSADPPERP